MLVAESWTILQILDLQAGAMIEVAFTEVAGATTTERNGTYASDSDGFLSRHNYCRSEKMEVALMVYC